MTYALILRVSPAFIKNINDWRDESRSIIILKLVLDYSQTISKLRKPFINLNVFKKQL